MSPAIASEPLLEVRGLRTRFSTFEGELDAVNGIALDIGKNESVGLVGETGCGKSVTALSILRLLPDPPARILSGTVSFQGRDLLAMSPEEMRKIRGAGIAMVFQRPMSSLNPTFRIGTQMADVIRLHQGAGKKEAWHAGVELLRKVEIALPEKIVHQYPHELSGGMRQRVMIATALSVNPKLLIADEPTTALDATIQKQILNLMEELRNRYGFSMLYISHDLRMIYTICQRLYVMYAGEIVEHGDVESVFENPLHPYFSALMNSLPQFGIRKKKLSEIPGTMASLVTPPPGCRFHPRCKSAREQCQREKPDLRPQGENHWVACFRAGGG